MKVEERGYKYATALRREMTPASMERYVKILGEVLGQPQADRLSAVASFLDSSMSAENMGYNPRRVRFYASGVEVANVDVELTGRQRPREVVLVLVPYGGADAARAAPEAHALAGMMALAHSMAGERGNATVRFIAVPLGVRDESGHSGLDRMMVEVHDRDERLMRVHILGGPEADVLEQIRLVLKPEVTGTVIQPAAATLDVPATLAAMTVLGTSL